MNREILDANFRFVREKPAHLDKLNCEEDFLSRKIESSKRGRPFLYMSDTEFNIVWKNVAVFVIGHLYYFYSFYLLLTFQISWLTWVFCEYIPSQRTRTCSNCDC